MVHKLSRFLVAVCPFTCTLLGQWSVDVRDVPRWRSRLAHRMALDSLRGRVVLFGEGRWIQNRDPVWEWDGTRWWPIEPSGPSPGPRYGVGMGFDPVGRRMIVFGGNDGRFNVLDETWSWDGRSWTLLSPATRPPARWEHAMVTDDRRGRIVLFGGANSQLGGSLDDTWEWDGSNWVQMHPALKPPPRYSLGMAFDRQAGHAVLFGGASGLAYGDTWSWDGASWQMLSAASPGLAPRTWFAMATDPSTGRPLLYGGDLGDRNRTRLNETWSWSGSNWLPVPDAPKLHYGGQMASDGRRVILFGGYPITVTAHLDTWAFDGSSWALVDYPSDPDHGQSFSAMTFHAGLGEFMGTSALMGSPPIFARVGHDRLLRNAFPPPPDGSCYSMGYDLASDRLIAFVEPFRPPYSYGAWSWDRRAWTRLPDPPARARAWEGTWWDPRRQRLVFMAAIVAGARVLMEWDGANWSTRPLSGGPTALDSVVYGYDPARDRVVAYGGFYGSYTSNNTWEWDGTAWSLLQTNSLPVFRGGAMAYFPQRSVMVMVCANDRDIYAWDGSTWTVVATGILPVPQGAGRVVVDPMRGRLLIQYEMFFPGEPNLAEISLAPLRADQRYPHIGETVTLSTDLAHEAGNALVVALSTSLEPGIPIRPTASGLWEVFPLASSPLLHASFQTTALDAQGRGSVRVTIPPMPLLIGQHIYAAGIVVRPGPGFGTITNSADLWIVR